MPTTLQRIAIHNLVHLDLTQSPDVPIPQNYLDRLKQIDESPFFVTLPIARVGAQSLNRDIPYSLREVQQIIDQVNSKRLEAKIGHLTDDERSSRYDLPVSRWVAAMLDNSGWGWGKLYIYGKSDEAVKLRDHFQVASALAALVGTSIYGTALVDENTGEFLELNLETIDIGDPERLGVPDLAAIPQISTEMSIQIRTEFLNDERIANMQPDNPTVTPPNELLEVRQELRRITDQFQARVTELESQLESTRADLTAVTSDRDSLQTEVGTLQASLTEQSQNGEALRRVHEFVEQFHQISVSSFVMGDNLSDIFNAILESYRQLRASEMEATFQSELANLEMADSNIRNLIRDLIGDVSQYADADTLRQEIQSILARPHIEAMLSNKVQAEMGFKAVAGGDHRDPHNTLAQTVQSAGDLARQYGLIS